MEPGFEPMTSQNESSPITTRPEAFLRLCLFEADFFFCGAFLECDHPNHLCSYFKALRIVS